MLSDLKLLVVGVPSANVLPTCLRLERGQSVRSHSFPPGNRAVCVREKTGWQLGREEGDCRAQAPALSASALTDLSRRRSLSGSSLAGLPQRLPGAHIQSKQTL